MIKCPECKGPNCSNCDREFCEHCGAELDVEEQEDSEQDDALYHKQLRGE